MSDPRASAAVGKAVRAGPAPHPTTLKCVDCGATAATYDHHLGYAPEHWLDVQPVCVRCNSARAWAPRATAPSESGFSGVLVRIPTWLLEELDQDARASSRSRNAHLNSILRERYPEAAAVRRDETYSTRGPRLREDEAEYIWAA